MKRTKHALLLSAVSMLLCLSMLVGSTFAWFTDTASTGVNKIVAGNLDIELQYWNDANNNDTIDEGEWVNAEGVENVFSGSEWEPGYTEVAYFKIVKKGSLAFEYKVATNVVAETEGTNQQDQKFKLSDYLQFGIVETTAKFADRAAARDAIETPNKFSNISTGSYYVRDESEKMFAMVVWMPEETGNIANHKSGSSYIPEIQFGVQVLATQTDKEEDSFNNQYDENATYPNGPKLDAIVSAPKTAEEFKAVLDTAFTGGTAGTITINLEDNFDFENNWETAISANYSGVNTVIINGNGHYIENMNQPLIEGVFGGAGTLTFKNLTIKNSTISAAGGAGVGIGVFMNNADSSASVTFENCKIDNVNITNTANDSTLGGFIGYSSAATLTFTNCSVINSKFNGTKDIGALVGYTQSAVTATGITVTGNTITSSNTSTYRVGALAGTFNVNPSTITITDVSNNTVTQANAADPAKKTSEYAGRIYADVTVNDETLTRN